MNTKFGQNAGLLISPARGFSLSIFLFISAALIIAAIQELLSAFSDISDSEVGILSRFIGILSVVLIAFYLYGKHRWRSFINSSMKDIRWTSIGLLSAIGMFFIFVLLLQISGENNQDYYLKESDQFNRSIQSLRTYASLMMLVSYNLCVPVLEEIIFRGFIFESLMQRFGTILAGIVSAILFAFTHVESDIAFFVPFMFVFGFVSALFVHYSGRIVTSCVFHIAYNVMITAYALSQSFVDL